MKDFVGIKIERVWVNEGNGRGRGAIWPSFSYIPKDESITKQIISTHMNVNESWDLKPMQKTIS